MRKKILVTGGAGYIGSHTTIELMAAGFDVIIADDLSNSNEKVVDRMEQIAGTRPAFEKINLADEAAVTDLFNRHRHIDSIIHFAAYKAVGESVAKPLLYYKNNLLTLILLLEQVKKHRIPGIIFSSSCTVYGQPDNLPVTEETVFKPAESPYGKTKQMGEAILRDSCLADNDLHAIALRYFNPVGAHPSALIGELPNGTPSNLVPFITQTAAGIRDQLHVFGDDYKTPDGSALRDYIHVVDLAKAHVAALARLLNGKQKSNYEYFNIGTGKSLSVFQLIKEFEKVNAITLNLKVTGRRTGDIEQIYADTTLANSELGWKAELGIDEMMRSAWSWQQKIR